MNIIKNFWWKYKNKLFYHLNRMLSTLLLLVLIFIGSYLFIVFISFFNISDMDAGFVSAILGGVISGGLTLVGVNATLNNQKSERFIELYPRRKRIMDNINDNMKITIDLYKDNLKSTSRNLYEQDFNEQRQYFQNIEEDSIIVNVEVYTATKEFLSRLEAINSCVGNRIPYFDETTMEPVGGTFAVINAGKEEEFNNNLKKLVANKEKLKRILNANDEKYKRLTGL